MRASVLRRRWLPILLVLASALTLGIFVLEWSGHRSSSAQADRGASDQVAVCSGTSATDYRCHVRRYHALVRKSGVAAAFRLLKEEYRASDWVKAYCHPLTHEIGRLAAQGHGDVASTYADGDDFCSAGYFHGAMEAFVSKIGARRILAKADDLCAPLRAGGSEHSYHHYACAHGLGHGFMWVLSNDLPAALSMCDSLADGWERDRCFGGVFMQNVMAADKPFHPSKYLRPSRPLYPCTAVKTHYKYRCYEVQIQFAAKSLGDDFSKAFALCTTVEDDFQRVCYEGLGNYAVGQGIRQNITDVARTNATSGVCALGQDYAVRSSCVVGAAKGFVLFYHSGRQAEAFCAALREAKLHALCIHTARRSVKYQSFGGEARR